MNKIRSPAPQGAFYFAKKIMKEGRVNGEIHKLNNRKHDNQSSICGNFFRHFSR